MRSGLNLHCYPDEPDRQISRIRLSDKTSRLCFCVRRHLQLLNRAEPDAELEDQLGVRLLDRSTRALRLTDLGSEVLEHAQRSAEASEAVENIVSNQRSNVTGTLRLSAPPNISDTLLTPLVTAFQASYPIADSADCRWAGDAGNLRAGKLPA
jgi:hypothetical protein